VTSGASFGVSAALARVAEIHTLRPSAVPAAPAGGAGSFASALDQRLSAPADARLSASRTLGLSAVPVAPPLAPRPFASIADQPTTLVLVPTAALVGAGLPGGPGVVTPTGAPSAAAARRVAVAAAEVGVAEAVPGSNDGPRIRDYRTATAGSGVGPWCSYFVSWVGAQAGTPLGNGGRGEGWVPAVQRQLSGTGAYVEATAGTGRPGDLVFFDRDRDGTLDHIGLVEQVDADGRVHTIEGNSSDAVRRRDYRPDEIAGYGRLP
jgi:cell wall-associated NlpC family hydrolase